MKSSHIEIIKLLDYVKIFLDKSRAAFKENIQALNQTSEQIRKIALLTSTSGHVHEWEALILENKTLIASNRVLIANTNFLLSVHAELLESIKNQSQHIDEKELLVYELERKISADVIEQSYWEMISDPNYLNLLLSHYESEENYEVCTLLRDKINALAA